MAEDSSKVKIDLGYSLTQQKFNISLEFTNIFFLRRRNPLLDAWRRDRIVSRAKIDARQNVPPTEAAEHSSDTERDILARRARLFQTAKDAILQWREKVHKQILKFRPNSINSDNISAEVSGQLNKYKTDYLELYDNDRDYADSYEQVKKFKEKHNIDRDGEVPRYRVQVAVIVLAIMMVETILNGILFQNISEQGFIGGWVLAVLLSSVNVTIGIFIGLHLLRYWSFPGEWRKVLFFVLSLGVIFFNFLVAHYRALAESALIAARLDSQGDVIVSPAELINHVFANPLGITSFYGISLFILGVGVAVVSAFEGYRGFTDRYPGYGRVWRRYWEKKLWRNDQLKKYKKRAHALIDAVLSQAVVVEVITKHFEREVQSAISQFETLRERAENWLAGLNSVTDSHLASYRSTNARERNRLIRQQVRRRKEKLITAPPKYFGEAIVLPTLDFERKNRSVDEWDGTLTQIQNNLVQLELLPQKLETLRSQIDESIRQALEDIQADEAHAFERASSRNTSPATSPLLRPRWWRHLWQVGSVS